MKANSSPKDVAPAAPEVPIVPEEVRYRTPQNGTNGHVNYANQGRAEWPGRAPVETPRYSSPVERPLPPSFADDDDEESINWPELFGMLRRRRKIVATTFAVVAAVGFLYTANAKKVYQATSQMELTMPQQTGASAVEIPGLSTGGDSRSRFQSTQIAIIQSDEVRNAALVKLTLPDRDAVTKYTQLSVTAVPDTDLVSVAVSAYDRKAAEAFSKALCTAYIAQSRQLNRAKVNDATAFITQRLQTVGKALDASRRALAEFQKKNKTIDFAAEATARTQGLATARDQLRAVEADRAGAEAQLGVLRTTASKMAPTQTVPTGITRRPVVEDLKKNLTALELKRLELGQEYAPGSEQIRTLDSQIEGIRRRLATEAQTEVAGWAIQQNEARQQMMTNATNLQAQIWAYEARGRALSRAVNSAQQQLAQLPDQQYRLSQLTTDMETLQATYQTLNEKALSLRLQQESSVPNARLVASGRSQRIGPNYVFDIVLSLVIALAAALGLAALVDRLDDRVHSQQEAEGATGLPILAQIPFVEDPDQRLVVSNATGQPHNTMLLESYRMLRTNIDFASLGRPLHSLAITSTQPNEGKSTVVVDLALAIALAGRKVIVVDVDLRRPSLHGLLGLENHIGFTNLVSGTATLEQALQQTTTPGLSFVSCGPIPPNPTELLSSPAAQAIWQQLMAECDLLIVDTPPAMFMADAQIVSSTMDATLIVVSMQEAKRRDIARTCGLLTRTGTNIIGAVLNKTRPEHDDSYAQKQRYYATYHANGA